MMDIMKLNDPCVTLALTVAGGSARVAIPSTDYYISVYNNANTPTFVKGGGADVEAVVTDTWIPPKTALSFKKDNFTHIAGINTVEDVNLLIQTGSGI